MALRKIAKKILILTPLSFTEGPLGLPRGISVDSRLHPALDVDTILQDWAGKLCRMG